MFFNSKKKKIKKRREYLCNDANIFIQVHFVRERNNERYKFNTLVLKSDPDRDSLNEWYESHNNPEKYSQIVKAYFDDSKQNEDSLCSKYLLDTKYFSKLEDNENYNPTKGEAISVCFAFKLNFEAAKSLLKSAGYAITNSEKTDLIVRYFLENKDYNISDLNYVLVKLCDIKLKDLIS